jgi:hypothetical protein
MWGVLLGGVCAAITSISGNSWGVDMVNGNVSWRLSLSPHVFNTAGVVGGVCLVAGIMGVVCYRKRVCKRDVRVGSTEEETNPDIRPEPVENGQQCAMVQPVGG